MSVKPGDLVDRYEIIAVLGAGGMGEVYHALDTRLQRAVALKLLSTAPDDPAGSSSGTGGSQGAARLLREARAVAALEHPNVVAIFDVGEVQEPAALRGTPYLAMELIRGKSLRAAANAGPIALDERMRWVTDIAKALSAAHDRGLVHRDVKPENVMIRNDGVVKVLDFGIAKRSLEPSDPASSTELNVLPTLTTKGVTIGTPYYMAPEQMRGEALDGRADQFAWGVLAYELLAGRGPWRRDGDALSLVSEVLSKPVDGPRLANPEIPPRAATVILRALSKSRDDRFATMDALLDALAHAETASSSEELGARPTVRAKAVGRGLAESAGVESRAGTSPTPARAVRSTRRAPWMVILAGVAVVAAAFLGSAMRKREPSAAPSADAVRALAIACASSAACTKAHGGAAHRCRSDGVCAPLASEDCTVHAEPSDLDDDSTVWVGAMYPLTGPSGAEFGRTLSQGVELARQDFSQTMASVVGKSGKVRPIGVIACDDAADAARAAKHLATTVRVPAVIGFRSGTEFVELAKTAFLREGTVMVASLSTSPLVTSLPQPEGVRLTWRTTYNIAQTAAPISAIVEGLFEPRVRAAREPRARAQPVKVGLLRFKNAGHLAFAEALFDKLHWNGASALDNGGSYRQFTVDDPSAAGDAGPEWESAVTGLLEFGPDVLVVYGGEPIVSHVLTPLEARWPARTPRPIYIDPTTFSEAALRFVGKDEGRRHRMYGLTGAANTPANARLVMHYNELFKDKITRTFSPNADYDAFYMVAYAALSLGGGAEPVTGAAIARAFARLQPPGRAVDVGPTGIFEAFSALDRGENIDLNGATGALDFDLSTGESAVDQVLLCLGADSSGEATEGIASGVSYAAATRKLEGKPRCP